MTDQENVTLRDVYDLVDNSRKETNQAIEKVNGDVVDLKVAVGQVETKLDGHNTRIGAVEDDVKKLSEKVAAQRVRAAELGGIAGVGVTAFLRALEWALAQLGQ